MFEVGFKTLDRAEAQGADREKSAVRRRRMSNKEDP